MTELLEELEEKTETIEIVETKELIKENNPTYKRPAYSPYDRPETKQMTEPIRYLYETSFKIKVLNAIGFLNTPVLIKIMDSQKNLVLCEEINIYDCNLAGTKSIKSEQTADIKFKIRLYPLSTYLTFNIACEIDQSTYGSSFYFDFNKKN